MEAKAVEAKEVEMEEEVKAAREKKVEEEMEEEVAGKDSEVEGDLVLAKVEKMVVVWVA